MAMLFNPTLSNITTLVSLPLYYTGLSDSALVSLDGGTPTLITLQRDYSIVVSVTMPPQSIHTVVIDAPPA